MSAHAEELSSAQRGQLMQELSSASSSRRAQLYHLLKEGLALSAHTKELSSAQRGQLMQELSSASSCRRAQLCQLMQESSALLKAISSYRSSAMPSHVGELRSAQRGYLMQELSSSSSCRRAQLCQLMQKSSATSHPL